MRPVAPVARAVRASRPRRRPRALLVLATLALSARLAQAGPFVVQPTRLELSSTRPSGALTVRNEGAAPLGFRIQGMRWTQDDDGQEHLAATEDLIYYPRLLTLPAGESAVIRLGLRQPPGATERTYRLFIEEFAAPDAAEAAAPVRIRVLVRFATPVFVTPQAPRHQLRLSAFHVDRGHVQWTVDNEGTQHQVFQSVVLRGLDAAGAEVFRQAHTGRYLLAGNRRRFEGRISAGTCGQVRQLVLEVRTDRAQLSGQIEAREAGCPPGAASADTPG